MLARRLLQRFDLRNPRILVVGFGFKPGHHQNRDLPIEYIDK